MSSERQLRALQEEGAILVYQLKRMVNFMFLARFYFKVCQQIVSSAILNFTDTRKFQVDCFSTQFANSSCSR